MNFESVNEAERPAGASQSESGAVADSPPAGQASLQPDVTTIEQPIEPRFDASVVSEVEAAPAISQAEQPAVVSDEPPVELPTFVAQPDQSQAALTEPSAESPLSEDMPSAQVAEATVVEAAVSGEARKKRSSSVRRSDAAKPPSRISLSRRANRRRKPKSCPIQVTAPVMRCPTCPRR